MACNTRMWPYTLHARALICSLTRFQMLVSIGLAHSRGQDKQRSYTV